MMWPLVLLAVVAAAVFAAKNRAPNMVPDIVIPGVQVQPFLELRTGSVVGKAFANGSWSVVGGDIVGPQVNNHGEEGSAGDAQSAMIMSLAPQSGRQDVFGSYTTQRGVVTLHVLDHPLPNGNPHYTWSTSEGLDGDAGSNRLGAIVAAVQAAQLGPVQQAQTGGP